MFFDEALFHFRHEHQQNIPPNRKTNEHLCDLMILTKIQ